MPDLDQQFAEALDLVHRLVAQRAEHVAEADCSAAHTCIGAAGLVALGETLRERPTAILPVVLSAVGEIVRAREESAAALRRLDVQRGMAADLIRELEALERGANDERDTLAAKIDDLEHRLAAAEAELTVYEESADVLGPVLPVAES